MITVIKIITKEDIEWITGEGKVKGDQVVEVLNCYDDNGDYIGFDVGATASNYTEELTERIKVEA